MISISAAPLRKAKSAAGSGVGIAHARGLEAKIWILSASIVLAYPRARLARPPDVGTCAPIRGPMPDLAGALEDLGFGMTVSLGG